MAGFTYFYGPIVFIMYMYIIYITYTYVYIYIKYTLHIHMYTLCICIHIHIHYVYVYHIGDIHISHLLYPRLLIDIYNFPYLGYCECNK